ncbi:MAG: deoxyribodipyrimidine photo-lyase [Desulfobacteraceae bacterium]|nr:deoxyribodipyrimidine photo-lyase [Desulfobacteraceae bacterium]
MIAESRIRMLQPGPEDPKRHYVLYWMQQSQRVQYNHALNYAIQRANALRLPLLVVFGLTDQYPEANARHYAFMLEGLEEVQAALRQQGISFQLDFGSPPQIAIAAARQAALVVCDRGYLRHQRQWRQQVAEATRCPVVEVESDAVVPTLSASNKAEFAARTIRPKIQRQLETHLVALPPKRVMCKEADLAKDTDFAAIWKKLRVDQEVQPVSAHSRGGSATARRRLRFFLQKVLPDYGRLRNRPEVDGSSMLSPYLHFGQISALEISMAAQRAEAPEEAKEKFLEELIVRRELAINYVWHNPDYDLYEGLPAWCRKTLADHRADSRDPIYTEEELTAAATHDPYWNAAMHEMKHSGYMHNYMRMYWGKKILEWSPDPQQAFEITLRLNNRYFLDGRDPNSYAGVGWIYGLHDRPWQERRIFGQIRYMARSGLERKFDMQAYVEKVHRRSKVIKTRPSLT